MKVAAFAIAVCRYDDFMLLEFIEFTLTDSTASEVFDAIDINV